MWRVNLPDLSKLEWETLCPDLTIEKNSVSPAIDYTSSNLAEIADHFWSEGYLKLDAVFEAKETEVLAAAMDFLKAEGIPPVYIYIYDQPWFLFERLRNLIGHFLGEEYALLPNLWAWHLWQTGDTGWPPHRDCDSQTVFQVGEDHMLMSLSLWVPLTDAAEENGCMSVIPRGEEHHIADDTKLSVETLKPFSKSLPAEAGAVLGWPQDLVHWGGEYSAKATNPRKSLSFEFQNSSFEPLAKPFLDTRHPPSFEHRLTLIRQQFEKYKHIVLE